MSKRCVASTPSPYDIGQDLCYDFTAVERFMNRLEVKAALGVDPKKNWLVCNPSVWRNLIRDMDNNATAELAVGKYFMVKP